MVDGKVLAKLDLLAVQALDEGVPEFLFRYSCHKVRYLLLSHCLDISWVSREQLYEGASTMVIKGYHGEYRATHDYRALELQCRV